MTVARAEVDRDVEQGLACIGPGLLEHADPLQDQSDDKAVELDRATRVDGRLDDRGDRRLETRHLRAEEALVLDELAGGEPDDRLKGDRVDVLQREEVVEHLRLDHLACLGHPDPLGQAGLLDRRGQAHKVALALGHRLVEADEAVRGGADRCRDLGDVRVGQVGGRADDDDASVELVRATRGHGREHSMGEPDVTRPEQTLVADFTLRPGKKSHNDPRR